jgi:hypothetical protein
LLYRGSDNGFAASNFHNRCDEIANTLTVILTTNGCIFGGFTPIAWDSKGAYKPDSTKESFLFQIKDSRDSAPRKFALSNSSYAIYCNESYGPTFGHGHDIHVSDCCNQNANSYTRLGCGYMNDTELNEYEVFTGGRLFTVKEIEVFKITE